MSEEDKETSLRRTEPLEMEPIKGVKGTRPVTAIRADEEKDQE